MYITYGVQGLHPHPLVKKLSSHLWWFVLGSNLPCLVCAYVPYEGMDTTLALWHIRVGKVSVGRFVCLVVGILGGKGSSRISRQISGFWHGNGGN
jgi:hypothetical protein